MRRSWGALHALAECGGFALTPLFEAVSFVGEKGACFFALAFVLMVFKRTRRAGTVMFVAICLGALATNIVLKDFVTRPRPFESSALFLDWWRFAGAAFEDGFSFPSGHMTAASAAMAAAVSGLSPVIMTVLMPIVRKSAKFSLMPCLTMSFR